MFKGQIGSGNVGVRSFGIVEKKEGLVMVYQLLILSNFKLIQALDCYGGSKGLLCCSLP